ncbi:MAG: PD-(D/E)XK nuclease family protein, partial [Sulfurimicrobium sp.]|nr:PD-(D/E)XK nuclease family protein [Sulfurimicrobium sp.]
PIVWLLDANAAQRNESGYRILVDWPPEAVAPRHFSLVSRKAELARAREHYVEAEAAHARRENLNLLYVAMTRAKQALIVSGCASGKSGDSWYQKIQASLQDAGLGVTLSPAATSSAADTAAAEVAQAVQNNLPVPPAGRREISRISAARRHGIQLHALLEWVDMGRSLPEQKEALQHRLDQEDSAFEPLWAEALELLRAPEMQRFFDPAQYLSAYNELSYQSVNGEMRRIDRLVEFADSVWVLDYKTTESTGADYSALATAYRPQMMDYRKAMASVFPGKEVRGTLIFPGPTLIEV